MTELFWTSSLGLSLSLGYLFGMAVLLPGRSAAPGSSPGKGRPRGQGPVHPNRFQRSFHGGLFSRPGKGTGLLRVLLPGILANLVHSLRSGQTLSQGLERLSLDAPGPWRAQWEWVLNEIKLGASTEQALGSLAGRHPSLKELRDLLQAVQISRRTGADLSRLLEVLQQGLEERERLSRRKESLTAQARLSGLLVGALPVLMGLVLLVMDPGLMAPLFTQRTGWGLLALAFLLEAVGFLWIRAILRKVA